MRLVLSNILFLTLFCFVQFTEASCRRLIPGAGTDGIGMSGIGNINVTDNYIQPPGSLITSTIVDFAPSYSYPSPETVVYRCDKTDIGSIYEMFATNGDDRVGGYFTIGEEDGLTGYYQNYVQYTGIRLTHLNSGQTFSRYWKEAPITEYDINEANPNQILIKAKHLSKTKVEIVKVSSSGYTSGAASNYCGNRWASTGNYSCNQPNGYIIFKGPGLGYFPAVGSDSANNWQGWPTHWTSIGLGSAPRAQVTRSSTCKATNVTPLVLFPAMTAIDMNNGKTVQNTFNITVECSSDVVSGTGSGQTAIGIQTSESAYQIADSLGFVNDKGGVSYLLSEGYGVDRSIATGVGIRLVAPNGQNLPFVGWKSCNGGGNTTICPTGYDGGWFPILSNSTNLGDSPQLGYKYYNSQFTAILQKLPGINITPGRVYAKGYVVVRVQ